jgi:hypothetical protein
MELGVALRDVDAGVDANLLQGEFATAHHLPTEAVGTNVAEQHVLTVQAIGVPRAAVHVLVVDERHGP